jgi:pimeloyl-ACP methyl ester carboxylesterase
MRLIEALLVCLSSLVFGFLDLLDPIMGSIFAVLDAVFEAGANGGAPRGGPANGEAPPGAAPGPDPRWSDCSCSACTAWQGQESEKKLHLHHVSSSSSTGTRRRRRRRRRTAATTTRGSRAEKLDDENVLFIHGFLSSSVVWSDKIFPRLLRLLEEEEVEEEEEFGEFEQEFEEFEGGEEGPRQKASYRLLAVDLLGFGRSPKPRHCLYSMEDHIETIDASSGAASIEHLVAHSMGCIVALAFAASRPPDSIKTITLVAPVSFFRVRVLVGLS